MKTFMLLSFSVICYINLIRRLFPSQVSPSGSSLFSVYTTSSVYKICFILFTFPQHLAGGEGVWRGKSNVLLAPSGLKSRARIFTLLRSRRIDSKEPIPPGCERQPYSYSVPSPHRLFKNSSTVFTEKGNLAVLRIRIRCLFDPWIRDPE
jgi:hypothetical protein